MSTILLPAAFEGLSGVAQVWARPTESQRSALRWRSSPEAFKVLYEAIMPQLDAICAHLRQLPVPPEDTEDRNLYWLACAFAEASPHHELYGGSAAVPHSFSAERFVASHDSP
ncbi:hypothetical protein BTL55_18185 [Bordetella trematum]|uniref:hypothetical protein n=1 Tax=Bordetella trematum TaxID=123899 RepID=UPI000472BB9A|nr:hypothetical protein [Bordetella trematum]AUL48675.1 hypothetical protein BTL55_18185 [Bordetella trematum]